MVAEHIETLAMVLKIIELSLLGLGAVVLKKENDRVKTYKLDGSAEQLNSAVIMGAKSQDF